MEVCSIVNSDDFGGVAEVVEEYLGVQLVAKSFQLKEEELTTNSVPLGPMILSVPSLISFPNSVKASEVVLTLKDTFILPEKKAEHLMLNFKFQSITCSVIFRLTCDR